MAMNFELSSNGAFVTFTPCALDVPCKSAADCTNTRPANFGTTTCCPDGCDAAGGTLNSAGGLAGGVLGASRSEPRAHAACEGRPASRAHATGAKQIISTTLTNNL
jgi:hypothetical protein